MSVVNADEKVFDQIGDEIFLRYRIGFSYPRQGTPEPPRSVKGILRFPAPPGAPFEKLYLSPLERGERLGKKSEDGYCWRVEYPRDPVLADAPFGELFLTRRPGSEVTFGRFGEQKPFAFSTQEGKNDIALVTPFAKVQKFNPLYIRVEMRDRPIEYFVLDIDWGKDVVAVTLLPVEANDVPEFLVTHPLSYTVGEG